MPIETSHQSPHQPHWSTVTERLRFTYAMGHAFVLGISFTLRHVCARKEHFGTAVLATQEVC